jgi:hypothetical protein
VSGRRSIERRKEPAQFDADDVVAGRDRGRRRRSVIRRLVKNRVVEPDDAFDVVLDFRGVVVMDDDLVRPEVAVRDGVLVSMPRLVDVLRCQP